MTGKPDPVEPRWDKVFDSLDSTDDEAVSVEAIQADLKGRGVNVDRVTRSVLDLVRQAQAKADLERAAAGLANDRQKLDAGRTIPSETIKDIRKYIEKRCDPALHTLYFSKLQEVSSPEDLQSLVDDLNLLDSLEGGNSNERTGGPEKG